MPFSISPKRLLHSTGLVSRIRPEKPRLRTQLQKGQAESDRDRGLPAPAQNFFCEWAVRRVPSGRDKDLRIKTAGGERSDGPGTQGGYFPDGLAAAGFEAGAIPMPGKRD